MSFNIPHTASVHLSSQKSSLHLNSHIDSFVLNSHPSSICLSVTQFPLQLQCITGPNGKCGCFACLVAGVHDGVRMTYPSLPPFQERPQVGYGHPELWTPHLGFTGQPALFGLAGTGFDCIKDFPLDAMHNVFLGIVKAKLQVWFSAVRRELNHHICTHVSAE